MYGLLFARVARASVLILDSKSPSETALEAYRSNKTIVTELLTESPYFEVKATIYLRKMNACHILSLKIVW